MMARNPKQYPLAEMLPEAPASEFHENGYVLAKLTDEGKLAFKGAANEQYPLQVREHFYAYLNTALCQLVADVAKGAYEKDFNVSAIGSDISPEPMTRPQIHKDPALAAVDNQGTLSTHPSDIFVTYALQGEGTLFVKGSDSAYFENADPVKTEETLRKKRTGKNEISGL